MHSKAIIRFGHKRCTPVQASLRWGPLTVMSGGEHPRNMGAAYKVLCVFQYLWLFSPLQYVCSQVRRQFYDRFCPVFVVVRFIVRAAVLVYLRASPRLVTSRVFH